jgi:DNA-binding response OmpR family regulator
VRLTPTEFRILHMLAMNEGRAVLSRRLVEYAWRYVAGDPVLLKTHICNIRQKLRVKPGQPGHIRTIPWVGYMLTRG